MLYHKCRNDTPMSFPRACGEFFMFKLRRIRQVYVALLWLNIEQLPPNIYTRRQSVMVRPMQPSPATSTTFSCQLRSTLIAAVAGSFAPGRPPTWLNPCEDSLVGDLDAFPGWAVAAIPL